MKREQGFGAEIEYLVLNQDKADIWADFCGMFPNYKVVFSVEFEGKEDLTIEKIEIDNNFIILDGDESSPKTSDELVDELEEKGADVVVCASWIEDQLLGEESEKEGQAWLSSVDVDKENRTLTFKTVYEIY